VVKPDTLHAVVILARLFGNFSILTGMPESKRDDFHLLFQVLLRELSCHVIMEGPVMVEETVGACDTRLKVRRRKPCKSGGNAYHDSRY
jgi:hypothetical protein